MMMMKPFVSLLFFQLLLREFKRAIGGGVQVGSSRTKLKKKKSSILAFDGHEHSNVHHPEIPLGAKHNDASIVSSGNFVAVHQTTHSTPPLYCACCCCMHGN
jgi:hypothetical protein